MENKYSEEIKSVLKLTYPDLATAHTLEFKNFFGAVTGYVDDNIFISCGNFGIALKLPVQTLEELFERKDVKHLRYFPKCHIKKEYAVLPKRIIKDKEQFKKLIDKSIQYVLKSS